MNRECIEKYMIMKSLSMTMLNNHLINKDEYTKIETFLTKKYCINIGSVYRQNDLI